MVVPPEPLVEAAATPKVTQIARSGRWSRQARARSLDDYTPPVALCRLACETVITPFCARGARWRPVASG